MKKTISRAFSLFLVLAILVGVMPAVLAAGELTVTGISAGKDWLSGAVSAERALGGSFSARKSLF